jgi:sialate O-acetylesterase
MDSFKFYEKEVTDWAKASDPACAQTESWKTPEFDDSSWATVDLPQGANKTSFPSFNGLIWFRRNVEVPASFAGQDLWLNLGPIQEQDVTWFNGVFVGGEDGYRRDHAFLVPGKLVKAGANVIAVRVLGNGLFIGKPEQLKLSRYNVPGESVSLAGPWKYQTSTPAAKLTGRKRQFERIWMPAGLFNGMVAPMAPFAIKGFLWYQGEGNSGQLAYEQQLTSMIRDWRAIFGQGDLPFYIVQLAGYGQMSDAPGKDSWAVTREIQARVARTVPNSGLAVAIDRGEINDIHPPNKRDVAERLAAVALAKAYKMDVPCEGPTYKSMKVEGDRIRISFDNAAGLKSLGSGPASFAIAGADKKFVWAHASIDGETVLVSSPQVKEPVAVRYGWSDNVYSNLYNKADFPAVPFRTDIW